jgi:hypothetical protein
MAEKNEYEDIARQMVRHENDLVNQRLTWLLTLEGLLFTALGFAWGKDDTKTRGLVYVLCGIGGVVPLLTLFILEAGQRALIELYAWWEKHRPHGYTGPGVFGHWHTKSVVAWIVPWRFLPIVFIVAWIFVAYFNHERPPNGALPPAPEISIRY